jgi:hypothetical protein
VNKKMMFVTVVASLLVLVSPTLASADETHTERWRYAPPAIGSQDTGGVCLDPVLDATRLRSGCIVSQPWVGDRSVRIAVDDAVSDRVSFTVGQRTPTGDINWTRSYCDTTGLYAGEGFPAQPGTQPGLHSADGVPLELILWIWGTPGVFNWDTGDFPPPAEPCPGAATTGTVTLTYYDTDNGT